MDLNKKNMKRIALLIAFGLLLYCGLNHPGQAGQMLSTVFSIFLPFLLGGCLAFLLNVILRPVERGWRRAWGKRYGPRQKRAQGREKENSPNRLVRAVWCARRDLNPHVRIAH